MIYNIDIYIYIYIFIYEMYLYTHHMIMSNKKEMNILYAIDEKRKDYSRYL